MIEVWLCKDDSILGGGPPCFHEVDGIPTAKRWVSSEDHTWGLVDCPQVTVNVGKVFQTTTADKLREEERGGGGGGDWRG